MKIPAVLSRLWRALRTPAPVAIALPAAKSLNEENIRGWTADILGRLSHNDEAPARVQLKLPTILPGVRPKSLPKTKEDAKAAGVVLAMDGGYEEPLAMDSGPPDAWGFSGGFTGVGLTFLGYPQLAELAQISEYRIPAESLSTEMTRTWMKLNSKSKNKKAGDKIKAITDRLEELKVRDLFREAALKTEQFGRAQIYISIRGQDEDEPRQLPLTELKKGDLLGFSCIEPYWITPYSWNSTHPERPDFYRPQSWYVLGRKTHHTRLMTFIFREVPDLLKPAYDFGGISITQLMLPYVTRWLRTAKSVNDLINIFSIVTLSTDLASMLGQPTDSPKGLIARLRGFVQARDNKGAMLINKDTEELEIKNVSLASLDKLQAQSQEHMATPGRMPLIKFFGIVPSGLNGGKAEGEFQAWYDYVHALQELGFTPHLITVLKWVQMDLFGAVDDDIVHEWLSLWEPTPKEEADIRKADAERDVAYLTNSVIDAGEVREKLKTDPESGYHGLQGDAPEPPEETEHALGEESADNEAQRQEQSAQAGHKRAKELAAAKPAPGGKK